MAVLGSAARVDRSSVRPTATRPHAQIMALPLPVISSEPDAFHLAPHRIKRCTFRRLINVEVGVSGSMTWNASSRTARSRSPSEISRQRRRSVTPASPRTSSPRRGLTSDAWHRGCASDLDGPGHRLGPLCVRRPHADVPRAYRGHTGELSRRDGLAARDRLGPFREWAGPPRRGPRRRLDRDPSGWSVAEASARRSVSRVPASCVRKHQWRPSIVSTAAIRTHHVGKTWADFRRVPGLAGGRKMVECRRSSRTPGTAAPCVGQSTGSGMVVWSPRTRRPGTWSSLASRSRTRESLGPDGRALTARTRCRPTPASRAGWISASNASAADLGGRRSVPPNSNL